MNDDIGVSLRDFDASIAEAYAQLFAGDPDKSREMLDWRFRQSPHGAARVAVASAADRVAGMIALVPTRLWGVGFGYQAIDTVVDPAFRGRGLFVRMGQVAQDRLEADVLWGFPNVNASHGWFRRLGWTNFGPAPFLIRPLRSSFLFSRIHPVFTKIDFSLVGIGKGRLSVDEDPEALVRDFGVLWQQVAPSFGVAVDRDSKWMRWRLLAKPGANYRCVGLRAATGELAAFVALKVTEKHGARLCYVMEAISTRERSEDLAALLKNELGRAAAEGAQAALAWCGKHAPNYRTYRRAGFLPLPPRFRPVEINFGAKALREEAVAAAAPGSRWYLSFLDSDTN